MPDAVGLGRVSARSRWWLFGGALVGALVGAVCLADQLRLPDRFRFTDRLRCLYRGHDPRRHPRQDGFMCSRCGLAGATLSDLGFSQLDDYVLPLKQGRTRDGGIERAER